MSRKIVKKIYTEELPHRGKLIDWQNIVNDKIRVNFIYDDIKDYITIIKVEIIDRRSYATIKYNDMYDVIDIQNLKKCKLGKILKKNTSDFKMKKNTIIKDDKRNITIIDMKDEKDNGGIRRKRYKYHCNKCGYEGWTEESNLINDRKCGCSCCAGKIVVEGINDIPTTASELIPYFQGGYNEAKLYTKCGGGNPNNPKGYIYPICLECGRVREKPIRIVDIYRYGFQCICNDGISMPNKMMFNILEQLGIDFKREYSPDWIGRRLYDFYFELNNKKYILEMDGGLGHGKSKHSKSKISIQQSQSIDDYKDKQAKEHGIEVIRIDCDYPSVEKRFEYIKQNVLNDYKLNELFDFSNIDWELCVDFTCSNLIKIVSDYWNTNKYSIKDITKLTKLNKTTVRGYLLLGNESNWCKYEINSNIKKIEILKDNQLLGIFKSIAELDKQSEELFGVRLDARRIGEVCNGKRKDYKGYTFRYAIN